MTNTSPMAPSATAKRAGAGFVGNGKASALDIVNNPAHRHPHRESTRVDASARRRGLGSSQGVYLATHMPSIASEGSSGASGSFRGVGGAGRGDRLRGGGELRFSTRQGTFGRRGGFGERGTIVGGSDRVDGPQHLVNQPVFLGFHRIQIEVVALGVPDDLAQRLAGSLGENP